MVDLAHVHLAVVARQATVDVSCVIQQEHLQPDDASDRPAALIERQRGHDVTAASYAAMASASAFGPVQRVPFDHTVQSF